MFFADDLSQRSDGAEYELAGRIILNLHDIANLVVAHSTFIAEVNNFPLPATQGVQCIGKGQFPEGCAFLFHNLVFQMKRSLKLLSFLLCQIHSPSFFQFLIDDVLQYLEQVKPDVVRWAKFRPFPDQFEKHLLNTILDQFRVILDPGPVLKQGTEIVKINVGQG